MKFNHAQITAIQHKDGPMLVLAGPGSGKTATLVERTKNLIRNYGVHPSNILVITFTNAAANEMKLRFEQEMKRADFDCRYSQNETYGSNGQVTFGTFHAIFFMVF